MQPRTCYRRLARATTAGRAARFAPRTGAVLVWISLLLVSLLGMVGLIVDGGLLMASYRQAQNAADAAATAAAYDLLMGRSTFAATATTFVKQYNGLSAAQTPVVNNPPASGPYANNTQYVEVIVTNPSTTYFAHLLPGIAKYQTVAARAVAGIENVTAGEGVVALNPDARPGIAVSGGGALKVEGVVLDNSEGGGVDENGIPVNNTQNGYGATGGNQPSSSTGVFAKYMAVVGGVDRPSNFKNIDPQGPSNILYCNQPPVPDPLLNLPTPTVNNGVDSLWRGSASATNGSLSPNVNTTPGSGVNGKYNGSLLLFPGIYESISITGGTVVFTPGIYVLSPRQKNETNTLKITGGNVTARGIMFYNTGGDYDANTGAPDSADGTQSPPAPGYPYSGGVQINASMVFSPVDTTTINYGSQYTGARNVSTAFNGMLFYQRRRNTNALTIEGNSQNGNLSGTLYCKWAEAKLTGQGTYGAQFIVGNMTVSGQGNVTVNYSGKNLGKSPAVYLVE